MKYSWAVWHINGKTGLPDDQRVGGQAGYTEAASPQALADQLAVPLRDGDRLMIWDTPGVGRPPVLVVSREDQ
jgi:hypothetical protein